MFDIELPRKYNPIISVGVFQPIDHLETVTLCSPPLCGDNSVESTVVAISPELPRLLEFVREVEKSSLDDK